MAVVANRKSIMNLFTGVSDIYSHRVRIVLAEKGINFESVNVDLSNPPEDLMELNPYGSVPTLVDRDLVLYDAQVIMEYLDERFPHPPLMPVDPVSRAQSRMTLHRVQRDWDTLVRKMTKSSEKAAAAKELTDSITVIAPIFDQKTYFMSDELSLLDCAIAPILWRLPQFGITLPSTAKSVEVYAERLFAMDSFQASLTEKEREIREG
ncbi:MAG: glutathione S-transferase N-terminal domain-containing protein [Ectothiorhodospiraceae bacterium]|nr:glutathione S-transferase N-terminal domain-containing protein [Ectothiorhodospiraceae bacterium]